MDARGQKGRGFAILAMVALASALSYTVGLQQGAGGHKPAWSEAPIEPQTIALIRDAAEKARGEGDDDTAKWFDQMANKQMEQMLAWAQQERSARPAARGD